MPATRLIVRTAGQIADEALGSDIGPMNWGRRGAGEFDDTVMAAADRVRQTLSGDEAVRLYAHVPDACAEYLAVIEELRGWAEVDRPGLVTVRIMVAMYWQMLTRGADES